MAPAIILEGKTYDAETGQTIYDAVKSLGFIPDAYLFITDGRPIPMDTPIEDAMVVKGMKVASGG